MKALFVREDSMYKDLLGEKNCFDINKDALSYTSNEPVICHPPCRAWGQLWNFAKPRDGEQELAIWAMKKVVQNGGVLEHPKASMLFKLYYHFMNQNGFILDIDQFDFGHRGLKPTKLFISGIKKEDLPPLPEKNVTNSPKILITHMSVKEREATPEKLALFLIEICKKIENNKNKNQIKLK